MPRYSIGLDYGTNSARCLAVDLDTAEEAAVAVFPYPNGENGMLLDDKEPELARQEPNDYIVAAEHLLREIGRKVDAKSVVGIGVDTTASTPLPIDNNGGPLRSNDLAAKAWLWKDHTSFAEAEEITELAKTTRPEFLRKCGGAYSSEWFWSKTLRCARKSPQVFEQSHTWLECCDFITASLTGTTNNPKRGICAAGHKGLFHKDWGGYPDTEFLKQLHPALARIRESLPSGAQTCGTPAGSLTEEWAARTRLPNSIPISVGGIDAHLGAIGSGIKPGTLVKILGTSSCDMAVWPLTEPLKDIPGISGIVPESILPGMYGLEAGQAAVGDLFNWFTDVMQAGSHDELSKEAAKLKPGQSGLLALDWNNGNRSTLQDPRLSGVILGQSLRTKPHEVYRALIEATAFGALTILQRLEEYGVATNELIICGGIAEKSPLVLQIYADVTGRTLKISRSAETCALGAAICGAVAGGAFPNFETAQQKLTATKPTEYKPDAQARETYKALYKLYLELQEQFGAGSLMKKLLELRDANQA